MAIKHAARAAVALVPQRTLICAFQRAALLRTPDSSISSTFHLLQGLPTAGEDTR
jgi:hypothetical protein